MMHTGPREQTYKALFCTLSAPHQSLAEKLQAKKRKQMIK